MAFLTFREMQRQVQAKVQNTNTDTSDADDLLPKIKDWINERYYRLYRTYYWRDSMETYDLTITASTAQYAFDRDVHEVVSIFDKTNAYPIFEDTIENHIRHFAIDFDKTGNVINDDPSRYRIIGTHTVKAEIGSTAEKIDVVSSNNTTDISPNCVHIEGLVSGIETQENITLTGTTSATSTNTYDANQKVRVSIGTTTGVRKTITGNVTIDGTTSGTTFSEISLSDYAQKYTWFKVSPTPKSSGTQPTWEIWYRKKLHLLDNDNDIPIIDCSIELIQGAFADALREDGLEQEANLAEQKFIVMTKELMAAESTPNKIKQFIPGVHSSTKFLDYGRFIT